MAVRGCLIYFISFGGNQNVIQTYALCECKIGSIFTSSFVELKSVGSDLQTVSQPVKTGNSARFVCFFG